MFSSLDVSTSGLVAQRTRLNAISSNIANMSTTRNEAGQPEPYQPRFVTFQTDSNISTPGGGTGVNVGSVQHSNEPPKMKYERYDPMSGIDFTTPSVMRRPLPDRTSSGRE